MFSVNLAMSGTSLTVFLAQSVYVVFDQANTQIGMAQRSGNATAAATTSD